MTYRTKHHRDRKRQKFMKRVQDHVREMGGHPGKINWNSATFMFLQGEDAHAAAVSIVEEQEANNEKLRP